MIANLDLCSHAHVRHESSSTRSSRVRMLSDFDMKTESTCQHLIWNPRSSHVHVRLLSSIKENHDPSTTHGYLSSSNIFLHEKQAIKNTKPGLILKIHRKFILAQKNMKFLEIIKKIIENLFWLEIIEILHLRAEIFSWGSHHVVDLVNRAMIKF